jgi:hypothetical protein
VYVQLAGAKPLVDPAAKLGSAVGQTVNTTLYSFRNRGTSLVRTDPHCNVKDDGVHLTNERHHLRPRGSNNQQYLQNTLSAKSFGLTTVTRRS